MITVRRAFNEEDEIQYLANSSQLLAMESEGMKVDLETLTHGLRLRLKDPKGTYYYVAQDEDKLVGCLYLTSEWSDWHAKWYWWIQGVYVPKEMRGKGIYRALVDAVFDDAVEHGEIEEIRLYAHHDNKGGNAAHAALGFKPWKYTIYSKPLP